MIVIGILFANMYNYVGKVNAADTSVKICRINVTAAARSIREMALNEDVSTYKSYDQNVTSLLEAVDTELKTIKDTGVVPDELYNEYANALQDWGNKGFGIIQ